MLSVPVSLVRCTVRDGEIGPRWLTAADHPWLREAIELFESLVGEARGEVERRLERLPRSPVSAIVLHVLWQLFAPRVEAPVRPAEARRVLFATAARRGSRESALAEAAAALRLEPEAVLAALFADSPSARRVQQPPDRVDPARLALACNTAILRRALSLDVALSGNAHAVVRHAKLHGLICTVEGVGDACRLSLSGPLALFHRTVLYGRAIAALVPALTWCRSFRLVARCQLHAGDEEPVRFVLTSAASIEPSREPKRFDSRVEARFARDFARATAAWIATREPEPVPACGTLIFPDFEIRHARDAHRRWWLEIVGFWTARYLETKLETLRAARLDRLILCVDRQRACDGLELPAHARIVWYDKWIDVTEVLAIVIR